MRHRSTRGRYVGYTITFALTLLLGVMLLPTAFAGTGPPQPRGDEVQERSQTTVNLDAWNGGVTRLGTYEDPVNPQVLVTRTGEVHLVWEDKGAIYHAWQGSDGLWQEPRRVAYGTGPSLIIDGRGQLQMVFAQNVVGNYEIYHVAFDGSRWSLPRNVSHTSGASYSPGLALAPDGTLHVVWNDNTPGEEVIYHATLQDGVWVNAPLPSAWGKAPSLHIEPSHVAHVLWQGLNATNVYDIYHMQGRKNIWQLPENISDSQGANSVGVRAVLDARGEVHMVWEEQTATGFAVYYSFSEGDGWLWPLPLSQGRTRDAAIATSERGRFIHVAWSDGTTLWTRWRSLASLTWTQPLMLAQSTRQAAQLRFAPENFDRLRALWRLDTSQGAEVWYGEGPTPIVQRLRFARVLHTSP